MTNPSTQIQSPAPYPWPHNASLSPQTTALIIIDMQRDFCDPAGYFASLGYSLTQTLSIIPRLQNLLTTARLSHFSIFHTREGHRPDLSTLPPREKYRSRLGGAEIGTTGPLGRFLIRGEKGHDFISELYPRDGEGEIVIDKPMRSAFQWTDLDLILRNKEIKNLIIAGVTTDVCVLSTVKDAIERGYDILLVEDCCAAAEQDLHDAVVKSVQMEGGIAGAVAKVDEVIKAIESWRDVETKA